MVDEVDWSGVSERRRKVAPLTAETFVERLSLLSLRVKDIRALRTAMQKSQQKS